MRIVGDTTNFYLPSNTPVYLDFQSANVDSDIYVSVVEYGSDGDNDWFK